MFEKNNKKWVPEVEIIKWQAMAELFIEKLKKSLDKQRKLESEPSAPPYYFFEMQQKLEKEKNKTKPFLIIALKGVGKCELL